MTRSQLREHCFKMLFCANFYPAERKEEQLKRYFEEPSEEGETPEGVEEILHSIVMSEKRKEFLKGRTEDVMRKVPELDTKTDEMAQGWETKRMERVDLTTLRLALYEMPYDDEVPEKVATNEAVELAKKFGRNKSPAFISGALAKLVQGQSMVGVYSVSQVNSCIKNIFTQDYLLNHISVKGEVSDYRYHSSGHIYFTLGDKSGTLSAVMFASQRKGLTFTLQEGQQVVVSGSMDVYERDGKYQLYAKEIRRNGNDDLFEHYQELRDELKEVGIFAPGHKQPILKHAKTMGIVTASTDAVIRDTANISARRNPYIQLALHPALVQGGQTKYSIIQGIGVLDKMGLDVIIVSHGDGSIEDLWASNEEMVARAIFEYHTPMISVAGHGTDVTVADYMADMRAPTPSATAEPAMLNYRQFEGQVAMYHQALLRSMEREVERRRYWLEQCRLKLGMYHPERQLRDRRQRLVGLEDRTKTIMEWNIMQKRHHLAILGGRLHDLSPSQRIGKGLGFIIDGDGCRVESVETLHAGGMMEVRLADDKVRSQVVETEALAVTADNAEGSGKAGGRK